MTNHPDGAEQARYLAHVQASREFTAEHPAFNPWHATRSQRVAYDTHVAARVAQILVSYLHDSPTTRDGQPRRTGYALEAP